MRRDPASLTPVKTFVKDAATLIVFSTPSSSSLPPETTCGKIPARYGRQRVHFLTHPHVRIARVIGIMAIAAGFVLGIEGLNRPNSVWLHAALGLIVIGLCAQGYAFSRSLLDKIRSRHNQNS